MLKTSIKHSVNWLNNTNIAMSYDCGLQYISFRPEATKRTP